MATTSVGPGLLQSSRWRTIRYSLALLALFAGTLIAWPGLLANLFKSKDYWPHAFCLLQERSLLALHVSSDVVIGVSYVAISLTLAYLVHRARRDIPFSWVFIAFGAFIIACGATHLMGVVVLYKPLYWLDGEIKLLTAIASIATALVLPPLVPRALAMVQDAKKSQERKVQLEKANAELEDLTRKLREIDELKTQFFANISHELRTPLALTLGRTEKLLQDGDLNETQRRDLQVVHRNSRALLKHVNDLLDVSKLAAGRMELHYTTTDVARLVRRVVANFDSLAKDRRISFVYNGPDSLHADVDSDKIERILLNLLSNAFKFTPEGGIVRCTVEQRDSRVVMSVSDSGPGIKPELREAVFERFRQVDGSPTRRFGGTGLGLAIVKDFAELHQGHVAVGEATEGGARFTVELPMAAPAGSAVASPRPADKDDDEDETARDVVEVTADQLIVPSTSATSEVESALANAPVVLVVEDNHEMNRFIVETLAGEYRVVSAFDGIEALQKASERRPDIVISDIMMPVMTGDQLLRELRSRAEYESIPVILLTARADQQDRVRALRAGAQDYIMKPFSVDELRLRVRNLISLSSARAVLQHELQSHSEDVEELAHEVTFRKRQLQTALEALRHSESRFRRLVESNVVGVITARLSGEVLEANDAYLNLVGYTREELRAGGLNWRLLTPPEFLPDRGRVAEEASETGTFEPYEKEYVRRDGTRVPVLVGGALVERDSDVFIAFIVDLSQLRAAEAARRESERQFRTVTEAIPQLVWTTGPDGYCDYLNARWYTYTGMRKEEALGRGWQNALHPEDRPRVREEWTAFVRGAGDYETEYRLRRHDGTYRWFLARGFAFRDDRGVVTKIFGTCTDIDDQKKAEEQREYLASIVESSDDAIFAKTLDGTITAWNAAAERIYGYKAEEIIGKNVNLIVPPDRHDVAEIIARIREGKRVVHYETERISKSGRLLEVSITVSPLRDNNGRIIGASTIARDVTEAKRAEVALRNSEKLATVGRLAATIAHEINNPLEAVSNVLYLLDAHPTLDPEARQYVAVAEQEVIRIAHIVRQTLGFHRESPEPVAVHVSALVDNVLDLHRRKIEAAGIALKTQFDTNGEILGFPGEMRQVISNLVGNAVEALTRGGKLRIRVSDWRNWAETTQRGVRVTVADSGTGIPHAALAHIFEPFFTTKGEKGTGLGLWVSQGIVAKHGGTIRVHSSTRPGRPGTAFSVFIPYERANDATMNRGERQLIAQRLPK